MSEKSAHLELDVKDFGPIAKAKMELRPLTVFVGPSNTGKSYLAILIYALHRFFCGNGRYSPGFPLFWHGGNRKIIDKGMTPLIDLIRFLGDDGKTSKAVEILLPPPVIKLLQAGASRNGESLAEEISRCFGVNGIDSLIRRQGASKKAQIVIRRPIPDHPEIVEHFLTLTQDSKFQMRLPENLRIAVDLDTGYRERHFISQLISEKKKDLVKNDFMIYELLEFLGRMISPAILGPLHFPAYYLPADRTGIMHAHNVVVTALISSASSAGLRPAARMPMLSGVLADFLEQLIEIDSMDVHRNQAIDRGENIEKHILGGSVGIQRESHNNYPRFVYRPKDWQDDLALANASSMVSELAPVVLYLRHIVRSGNVLIVEEPESHLHPAMQVEFMRQLSALVNAGIKVIVTTHSEWLLEELANIVQRSESKKLEYDTVASSQIALRPDQVGAWLFEPKHRPKGSVVREILPGDSGLYPSGYDDVAAALHNDWADMSSETGAAHE